MVTHCLRSCLTKHMDIARAKKYKARYVKVATKKYEAIHFGSSTCKKLLGIRVGYISPFSSTSAPTSLETKLFRISVRYILLIEVF